MIIPDGVTSIGKQAFDYCDNLKSMTVGKGVASIGCYAFGYNDARVIDGFTVTGYVGSAAEAYAKENNLIFIAVDETTDPNSNCYLDKVSNTMPNDIANTTAETIILNLSAYGITVTITDKDGNRMESTAMVGTGFKVTDQNGNTYTVIVKGDVDGSGEIDITDYLKIKAHFLEIEVLEGIYFTVADIDESKEIDVTDYLKLKSHFLSTSNIYE